MTDEIKNALENVERKKQQDKATNDVKGSDQKKVGPAFKPVKGDEADKADRGRSQASDLPDIRSSRPLATANGRTDGTPCSIFPVPAIEWSISRSRNVE
jgi:hypothetical protein